MRATIFTMVSMAAVAAAAGLSTSLALQIGQPRLQQLPTAKKEAAQGAAADALAGVLAALPPWTRATLEAGGGRVYTSAPVTAGGQLVFADVPAGSYLGEVHCATHVFPPLRVDVAAADADGPLRVTATETYRGNDWSNRGEALVHLESVDTTAAAPPPAPTLVVRPLAAQAKSYYTERSGFSALSVLSNPMILIALVTMGLVFGMPYLMENMDPEMKAEWEEAQKKNPVNSIMSGGGGGKGAQGFDMAAYLAGSKSSGGSGGGGGGGAQRGQGVRR